MPEIDAQGLADQARLIGLLSKEQISTTRAEAEDGSLEAFCKVVLRKGYLTSWQLDRLLKGDIKHFFFGGCKVLFHIAEGTFARVYRGIKEPGNHSVAIKVLRKRFTTDPDSVKRFYQEAEAGMKLAHPNIVRIHDFGEEDKTYFMIMEYVEGMNLRNFLKLRHRLSAKHSLPLMIQLADALNYSLGKGITHRDIKATNVLISNRGEAKLVDFGLATIETDERKLEIAHGIRTVDYSALERTCGSTKGDPRSDIYFLGCVYYQMLTGTPPMPETETHDALAKMLKRSFGAIRPIGEHSHAPPDGLAQIIDKMMKVDLKSRYQSMEEVLVDLQSYERRAGGAESESKSKVRKTAGAKPVEVLVDPEPESGGALDEEGGIFQSPEFEVPAIVPRNLLCVEVQETIQDAFRKTLSKSGFRVILMRDAERALERFQEEIPDLLVFDADGLGPDAINSFVEMRDFAESEKKEVAYLVVLGPRQALLKHRLPGSDRMKVLVKPIKMKDIQDAIEELMPTS